MARIVMADDGLAFDGRTLAERPLGGAETAFILLAEALAQRGHAVLACTNCLGPTRHNGVDWAPISGGVPEAADLYIANRGDQLLLVAPRARAVAFWIHNPADYLLKWRYLSKLWRRRPVIVFSGPAHAATYPRWAPDGGRAIILYGIAEGLRRPEPAASVPPPRAIFTSNPLRSLDWLLKVWRARIHPRLPAAELHVFSGAATYGAAGEAKAREMAPILERARALGGCGVRLRAPLPRAALAAELGEARVFLYRGDPGESFCMAAGEAQAMGVPGVVCDIACMSERVKNGASGFVVPDGDEAAFAAAAIGLLSDDAAWRRAHVAAMDHAQGWTWAEAARRFEALIEGQLPPACGEGV
ncbi:MAG: glycosyltransferase [Pseudomonadota bacterium]